MLKTIIAEEYSPEFRAPTDRAARPSIESVKIAPRKIKQCTFKRHDIMT